MYDVRLKSGERDNRLDNIEKAFFAFAEEAFTFVATSMCLHTGAKLEIWTINSNITFYILISKVVMDTFGYIWMHWMHWIHLDASDTFGCIGYSIWIHWIHFYPRVYLTCM